NVVAPLYAHVRASSARRVPEPRPSRCRRVSSPFGGVRAIAVCQTVAALTPIVCSTLEDLFLTNRDRPAPPALVTSRGDVLASHPCLSPVTIPHGESHMVRRSEVCRMRLPGLPLFARCTAPRCQQPTADQNQVPPHAPHVRPSGSYVDESGAHATGAAGSGQPRDGRDKLDGNVRGGVHAWTR